ncbi:hypothetical protein TYRP_012829 [Tyrophagus putrescentiae]|nr:hypothetical protein TYRP_012829 [Tyrophagus putrescentiae]
MVIDLTCDITSSTSTIFGHKFALRFPSLSFFSESGWKCWWEVRMASQPGPPPLLPATAAAAA